MTTNQTIDAVPRELLLDIEYWLKHMEAEKGVEGRCMALKELRALLDAPASIESLVGRNGGGMVWHECAVCHAKGSYHPDVKWCICGRPFDVPAAQPQGELVASERPAYLKKLMSQVCDISRYLGDNDLGRPGEQTLPRALELIKEFKRLNAGVGSRPQAEPVAVAHQFAEKVIRKLERFQECADDGQGADIGRHWFDLLTQLGLLNRVQRSPALWEMTQQGEDALELSRQSAKSR